MEIGTLETNKLYVSITDTKHRKKGDIVQPLYVGKASNNADAREVGYVYVNEKKKTFALAGYFNFVLTVRPLAEKERLALLKSRNITNTCQLQ